jgi:hypothetical protein
MRVCGLAMCVSNKGKIKPKSWVKVTYGQKNKNTFFTFFFCSGQLLLPDGKKELK